MESPDPISKLPRSAIGLSIVACAMIAMLVFSWRKWPDPLVDFGRELYVPWQLAQGKSLYRDIAYFNGPLSPEFNAIVFRVFGASLMTLVWVNILVLAGVIAMLHRIAARMSDEFTATVACVAFVLLLAIGQPGPAANYNFITPYSHEITHGLALSLGALACLMRYERRPKRFWPALAGSLLGLAFLTKPEIFLAAVVACLVAAALLASRRRVLMIMLGAMLVPPIVATLIFGTNAIGGWRWAFDPAIVNQPFYKIVRGTDDIGASIGLIAMLGLGYLLVLGIPILAAKLVPVRGKNAVVAGVAAFMLVAGIMSASYEQIDWANIARPLIVITPAIGAMLIYRRIRSRALGSHSILPITFATLSFVLLLKIPLRVLFYHYGFALAAPALVLAVVAFVGWIPRWIDSRGGCGAIARFGSLGALVVLCAVYINFTSTRYSAKTIAIGSGANRFYADAGIGRTMNAVLAAIEHERTEHSTLAVVPQGAMINFLTGRANPTAYPVVMPPEVIMFGGDRITDSFKANPPDLILLAPPDLKEYGYSSVRDYEPTLIDWINANYTPVKGTLLRRTVQRSASHSKADVPIPSPPEAQLYSAACRHIIGGLQPWFDK